MVCAGKVTNEETRNYYECLKVVEALRVMAYEKRTSHELKRLKHRQLKTKVVTSCMGCINVRKGG